MDLLALAHVMILKRMLSMINTDPITISKEFLKIRSDMCERVK